MAITNVEIHIGDLNTQIEIQKFEHKTDEYGFNDFDWKVIAKPRCKVESDDRLIRQVLRDDGVDATTVKLFTMRYIPNITTKDRIFYKGMPYEIYSIYNFNEKNRFMRIYARQIDPIS